MAKYDPAVLEEYADDLYSRARWITFQYALGFGVIGAIVTALLWAVTTKDSLSGQSSSEISIIVGAVIAALIGFAIGRGKSFSYRLEAQMVLCQLQMEINTRKD